MSMKIGTNISSMQALRALRTAQGSLDLSTQQLSSGQRITKAGDDAAGLSISSHLKAGIRSQVMANRNTQDAVSLVQVAEGSFNELNNIFIRLRELAIHSSSDTIGYKERGMLQAEAEQLLGEVDRIADSTEWNGMKILNGETVRLDVQVGTGATEADRLKLDTAEWATTAYSLGAGGVKLSFKESSRRSLGMVDQALNWLQETRSKVGAFQNRLLAISSILGQTTISHSEANSRIADTDVAQASSENTKAKILASSAIAVNVQANNSAKLALKLLE